jgi:hypothetical protein
MKRATASIPVGSGNMVSTSNGTPGSVPSASEITKQNILGAELMIDLEVVGWCSLLKTFDTSSSRCRLQIMKKFVLVTEV